MNGHETLCREIKQMFNMNNEQLILHYINQYIDEKINERVNAIHTQIAERMILLGKITQKEVEKEPKPLKIRDIKKLKQVGWSVVQIAKLAGCSQNEIQSILELPDV